MEFTPLVDEPDLFQATAETPWLSSQPLTLFIEIDGGTSPSPAQLELAREVAHHDGGLRVPIEEALFDYLRWIRFEGAPAKPGGVWALLEAPQAWFNWRCEDTPPTFRLCWPVRPMDGDLVAVEVTPWSVLGVGEFGASRLEALSFIRAQLEPVEPPEPAQCPPGRKTCRACRGVSLDVTPACPACGAPRWWAAS